jgi:hypothetical protein
LSHRASDERSSSNTDERIFPPVIPDGVMRAEGGQHSDPGPREFDSSMEVPDSLAALGFRDDG